jgi:L-alanine-DL-glutamate epimerase-like enolase superfamily enzyme
MKIHIHVQSYTVPLRSSFKHHSAERKVTETVLVTAERNGLKGYGESCPRSYVTGETVEGAISWIHSKIDDLSSIQSLNDLKLWNEKMSAQIDGNLSAYCAIELAFLDLLSKEAHQSLESFLGIPESTGIFHYSAVVSDEKGEKLEKILKSYLQMGFYDFKFKLSGVLEEDQSKFSLLDKLADEIASHVETFEKSKIQIRVDANNIWTQKPKEALEYIKRLNRNFSAIEEPLGAHEWEDLSFISTQLGTPIILDESLLNAEDMKRALTLPGQWIPNIRISKVGGILRALKIAKIASEAGCKLIIGAQVGETSLLTRAALSVAQAFKKHVIAQEGAFGTLLIEKDIVQSELRFGKGGLLNWQQEGFGFGLHIDAF